MIKSEIRLKGASNFRDLGGYPTANGRKVRRGLIFRSGDLSDLTNDDVDLLSMLRLRLVCDLRSEQERKKRPNIRSERFVHETLPLNVNADLRASANVFDILREDPSERGAIAMMVDVYRSVPDLLSEHMRAVFSALTTENRIPLVFHCTVGKDRAGVLSAIILLALGVHREAVYEDYLKTNKYQDFSKLQANLAEYLAPLYTLGKPPQEVVLALLEARGNYLDAALAVMDEKQGHIDDYLQNAGITKAQTELLRTNLLE